MTKRLASQWMIAAATLVVAAGSASAQTLRAEIPYTFRAGKALMTPGAYTVGTSSSGHGRLFVLRNEDTGKSVILAIYSKADVSKAWKADSQPKLRLECVDTRCSLRELWDGSDDSSYRFPSPKPAPDVDVRIADIGMTRVKGE